jgi:hypothetical protein
LNKNSFLPVLLAGLSDELAWCAQKGANLAIYLKNYLKRISSREAGTPEKGL